MKKGAFFQRKIKVVNRVLNFQYLNESMFLVFGILFFGI